MSTKTRTSGPSNGHRFAQQSVPGFEGDIDPLRLLLVANTALLSRQDWINRSFDPDRRRDINKECGYPDTITLSQYQREYERNAIANRVVQVMAKESWQVQPRIFEKDDPNVLTTFEKAWAGLARQFRRSYRRQSEKATSIWEYLLRADILSGIGQYGVILLGLDDRQSLDTPAYPLDIPDSGVDVGGLVYSIPGTDPGPRPVPLKKAPRERKEKKLIYLRVMPESLSTIERYEENEYNPRYGLPVIYNISMSDPKRQPNNSTQTVNVMPKRVHWTRVVHIADGLESSEFLGVPRQQTVFDNIRDIKKVTGGSAEMYWKGAFPGLSIETHPSLGGDVQMDVTALKSMIENYINGLQRYLNPSGATVKSLSPQVVDPSPQIERQIEQICIKLGIPKRIFMGSERGELASSQDDAAWNDRLRERQHNYITPRIIEPFVDRLIDCGVLPFPEGMDTDSAYEDFEAKPGSIEEKVEEKGYAVHWPDLTSQTITEKANVAFKKSQALSQYVTSKAYVLMNPIDYFVRVWGMEEEEARAVWEARDSDPSFKEAFKDLEPPQQPGNDFSKKGDDNGGSEAKRNKQGDV